MRPFVPALLLWMGCPGEPGVDSEPVTPDSQPGLDTQDSAPVEALAPVSGIAVSVHDRVSTMLELSWTQDVDAELAWVEFGLEGETWLSTPPQARTAGAQSQMLLGMPALAEVGIRVVNQQGDELLRSEEQRVNTGALPEDLPLPHLVHWDPSLGTAQPWLFGSLGINDRNWYAGPWYLYVMDRQARIVWYHPVPEGRCAMHARVALSGDHLLFEETTIYQGDQGKGSLLRRMGLDFVRDETILASGLGSTFAELPDGAVLFDSYSDAPLICLDELQPDGSRRRIWVCTDWLMQYDNQRPSQCDPNETIWVPETDSVIWSMWPIDTLVEVDRESGTVLKQLGALEGSWSFDPPSAGFDMQHYPYYTADGTLLVSTHVPGVSGQHRAMEYAVDTDTQTLRELWSYGDEVPHYPTYAGEALRLEGGNTLVNYGSDGALREITPDKRTAWQVEWDSSYLLGHVTLVDDLYALTGE